MTTTWAVIGLYLLALAGLALFARGSGQQAASYLFMGRRMGPFLGFLTFSATLFSTFTILGMPDYFRVHGIGSWYFLGITDVALAFVALLFGYHLRRKLYSRKIDFSGVSDIIRRSYGGRFAVTVYTFSVFAFLLPYVSIQIKGSAFFMEAVSGGAVSGFTWAMVITAVILVYSWVGGLKAIVLSDVVQGIMLCVVVWIVAWGVLGKFGGVSEMFSAVKATNSDLLSLPGPHGRFSVQFLALSFLSIILMPLSQPQLTHRLAIVNLPHHQATDTTSDLRALKTMAVAVALFAIVVILPTLPIGLYGAVHYADKSASEFVAAVFIRDQSPLVAGLVSAGLLAAAMSTTDSQLFSLSIEATQGRSKGDTFHLLLVKGMMVLFAILAFLMAFLTTDQIVDLARTSFIGTAMIAPMVLFAVLSDRPLSQLIPFICMAAVLLLVADMLGYIPKSLSGINTQLLLLVGSFVLSGLAYRKDTASVPAGASDLPGEAR